MTVTVMKTKAELARAEQFAAVIGSLPGSPETQAVRSKAFARFAELGLPHRRIEAWKYTDLRAALKEAVAPAPASDRAITGADVEAALGAFADLDATRIVFLDGHYRKDLSTQVVHEGVRIAPLSADFGTLEAEADDAVTALNTAFATDGAVIRIAAGASIAAPVLVVALASAGAAGLSTLRHRISAGERSKATVVELYAPLGAGAVSGEVNALTEVTVGEGAHLTHVKALGAPNAAVHLSNWRAELGADATYRGFQLTADAALARNGITVTYGGEGGKLDLSGVFLGRGSDHVDTTLTVDHAVPQCESRELFAGVLDNRARGIFQGKIMVRPQAQKTDGKQLARALMLSPDAEFDSKPELEIYADDVVCGHGSTAAELDEDQLFYCRSRGIPEAEARALLIESFIGEAINKVEHEGVQAALLARARAWFKTGADAEQGQG